MQKSQRIEVVYALIFLAPFLLHLTVFFGYSFVKAVWFSFTDKTLFSPGSFVGIKNYIALFQDPRFILALQHSISFMLIVTLIQTFLALAVAAILNQKIRGIAFFRTVYYVPSILSSAAVTLVALWFFQKNGFLNTTLGVFSANLPIILTFMAIFVAAQLIQVGIERARGLVVAPTDPALASLSLLVALLLTWLLTGMGVVKPLEPRQPEFAWYSSGDSWLTMPIPLWAIVIQNIFTTIPTLMIIFLAGLQDIPKSTYEAASIDGASPLQQFWRITVPMLRPVTFLVITLSMIGTLQMFDQVALLGNAAPLDSVIVLAYYVYDNVFGSGNRIGLASAAAMVLALLTFAMVLLQRAIGISDKAN